MGTFNRKPRIFISSVERGLSKVRENICNIIKNEFGWNVWCSGHIDPILIKGSPRSICLDMVEWADLFIGIFSKRYGSIVEPPGLSVTELELHRAFSQDKFIRIYLLHPYVNRVIKNPRSLDERKLKSLIDIITSFDSFYVRNVKSPKFIFLKEKNIYNQIRIDLNDFGRWWFSPHSDDELKSVLYVEKIMSDMNFLIREISESTTITLTHSKKRWVSEDDIREKLKKMSIQYSKKSFIGYKNAVSIGSDIFHDLFILKRLDKKDHLWLMADFLEKWVASITAVGHFRGVFGGLSSSIALMQIYEMLEYFPGYYGTANAISSCYYTLGNDVQALKWNDIAYFGVKNFPKREMGISSVRGRILLRKKQFKEAEKCFQNCLKINWKQDFSCESYGLHLSGLGIAEINLGIEKEGKKKLLEAEKLCKKAYHPEFLVRTKRALAEYYKNKGNIEEARHEVIEALKICKKQNLSLQKKRLEPLALQLGINPYSFNPTLLS